MARDWHRYETLRPDQLRSAVDRSPVAYWPLGLLEHHGWHLPVGYDGIKADRLCMRLAERTGGVILPVMWWGALGGHGEFAWTLYQDTDSASRILGDSAGKLPTMGFRVVVIVAGHYPWQKLIDEKLPALRAAHPDTLFLAGNEMKLGEAVGLDVPGDHAARWETAYGQALLPEYVDMDALSADRSDADWPGEKPQVIPKLSSEPADPLFAQLGEDPRDTSSAEEGNRILDDLCDRIARTVDEHLNA